MDLLFVRWAVFNNFDYNLIWASYIVWTDTDQSEFNSTCAVQTHHPKFRWNLLNGLRDETCEQETYGHYIIYTPFPFHLVEFEEDMPLVNRRINIFEAHIHIEMSMNILSNLQRNQVHL
jgi:hypothetical protein